MNSAISACGLTKSFGSVHAVQKVNLEVRRGEIYGFLGCNGAGKTTTIRMLLGLIRPSSGEIAIFGESLRTRRCAALSKIGFLVESAKAYPNLTVRENLEVQRRLTEASKGAVEKSIELLNLKEYADRKSDHLSLGNLQRLALARALVHSPEILILDEPANGLDPAGIIEIRRLLRNLADAGTTIFMSSHILSEVDQLVDRIGIIHRGCLVEELNHDELGKRKRLYIDLSVDQPERAEAILREKLRLNAITRPGERSLRIADAGAKSSEIASVLVKAGIGLDRLLPVDEDLEAHFMRITGEEA
ncbi:MAG: ABC transporter ATP-binding protein [Spirochaetes bacterium]|nr:ABC transporter ATP-binding protein [Spirochaetota bacterium]